jgi:methionyl aminopeptidase
MIIQNQQQLITLREGGKRLAEAIRRLADLTVAGVSLPELDREARKLLTIGDDQPAFLNYTPEGADRPFPASLCISVNDEIVHGVPNESDYLIKDGDLVSLDVGLIHGGLITDSAYTVAVGGVSSRAQELLDVTQAALRAGVQAVQAGGHVGDIGAAIQATVKPHKFAIFRELVGHGVGEEVHEEPYVPNVGQRGRGPELLVGQVIAIEPMLGIGTDRIKLARNGYTYLTADGSLSAHFEHTVVVTEEGAEVLTQI